MEFRWGAEQMKRSEKFSSLLISVEDRLPPDRDMHILILDYHGIFRIEKAFIVLQHILDDQKMLGGSRTVAWSPMTKPQGFKRGRLAKPKEK